MGLDIVEFVMGVEDAFGVRIPAAVAAELATPRHVIDCLHARLPPGREGRCLSQRAFYLVRRAVAARVGRDPAGLRPGTAILAVLPAEDAGAAWADVGRALRHPAWPRARGDDWLSRNLLSSRPRTLGDAARHVATVTPNMVKPAGEGWSRGEVAAVVVGQMRYHLAVREFSLDDRFVEDFGIS